MKAPIAVLLAVGLLTSGLSFPASPVSKDAAGRWAHGLSLRQKVAQMVVSEFFGEPLFAGSEAYKRLETLVAQEQIGGLILINPVILGAVRRADPYAVAAFVNRMQRLAKIPLVVAGDFERGPSMRVEYTTPFPHAMAFAAARDPGATRAAGAAAAREARAMGVQWVFSPVADVNNNPGNPVINIRAFSENPAEVATHVKAFLEGLESDPANPVLTNVKHFPGHGDTDVDSHLALPVLKAAKDRMETLEFTPFRAAIAAGVDSIMSAHIAVPALGGKDIPSTLYRPALSGLLRDELHFPGLIVTDALNMGAIVRGWGTGEVAVKAVEAGADILLMPPDPKAAIDAVVAAVGQGRLTEARIDQSVQRILAAKAKVELDKQRLVDIEGIATVLPNPEFAAQAQDVANRAVTLLRNADKTVQKVRMARPCVAVLQSSRISRMGLLMEEEFRKRRPKVRFEYLNAETSRPEAARLARSLSRCGTVTVADFATPEVKKEKRQLPGELGTFLHLLARERPRVAYVAFTNPYAPLYTPHHSALLLTFSFTPVSEVAAVQALLGEIPITGRTPVTIPGTAQYGDGLDLPAAQASR